MHIKTCNKTIYEATKGRFCSRHVKCIPMIKLYVSDPIEKIGKNGPSINIFILNLEKTNGKSANFR